MPAPHPSRRQQLDRFFHRLARAPARGLLLDDDGTLAPLRRQRDRAAPYARLREALAILQSAGHTRLVVVSSCYSQDLLGLLNMDPPPEIWGSCGWERRFPDGRTEIGHMDPAALQGLAEADDWIESQDLSQYCEQKPGCLAVHLRGLPESSARVLRERVLDHWRELAWRTGLDLTELDEGLELRVPGRTKGDAVRAVLSELPTGSAVACLCDDRAGEDVFEALGRRGLPVRVLTEPPSSRAGVWVRLPEELLRFLGRWHDVARRATARSRRATS